MQKKRALPGLPAGDAVLETWRLLDTGLASAPRNIALSRALLEARSAEESGSTLRFLRYVRSALLASHQSRAQEVNATAGAGALNVQRRITSGTTWYADERQLGWELYLCGRDLAGTDMQAITRRVGHAAAAGLSALGCEARYRRRDEIEVEGRTVCFIGHIAERGAVLLQGLLFIDIDYAAATDALRLPGAGGADAGVALMHARVCGLKEVLGRSPAMVVIKSSLAAAFECEFDMELREGDLSLTEHARFNRVIQEVDTADWIDHVPGAAGDMRLVSAESRVQGGTLRASVKYEASSGTIRQAWFWGDIDLQPARALFDLEATLRDLPISAMPRQLKRFFAGLPPRKGGTGPADFLGVVRLALATRPSVSTPSGFDRDR